MYGRPRSSPTSYSCSPIRTSTGELDLTFFRPYGHQGKLVPGAVGLFAGRASRFNSRWQLTHPSYEIFQADAQAAITWSAGVGTSLKTEGTAKSMIGRGSGESIQMAFSGQGWVLVQPSEGRPVVGAGSGA